MYRSIEAKFWTDPKVRELSPLHKLLFLYLITNSHTHVSGIYYLPKVLIQHETGISMVEVERGIDTLSNGYFCEYDTKTEVVWVRKMARYQGRGQLIKTAVVAQLKTLHNCSLIKGYLEEYDDWNLEVKYPFDTPSKPHRQQEQEKEQEKENKDSLSSEVSDEGGGIVSVQDIIEGWNTICGGHGSMPKKLKPTDTLKQKIRLRLKEHPDHQFWETVFNNCAISPFVSGSNGGWRADLNWLVKNPDNCVKVYEGGYSGLENRRPTAS